MPVIKLETFINAPIERVFDLSLSIDIHADSASASQERAVAGVTSGLIGLGQQVTWRAKHFGVWQTLTVRITALERPNHFTDTMLRGAFQRMEHHHDFEQTPEGTVMKDTFKYASPLGILGRIADWLFLERYMRAFLLERNQVIKDAAESDLWQKYIRQS